MKRHRQIADFEQWLVDGIHAAYLNVLRGSNASRTASPMKISNDSMIATAKNPVKPSHGACTFALPCDSNSPSEGEPGGNAKPRKTSTDGMIATAKTPVRRSHGPCTLALPCDSNSPSEGEHGGNPKPRKSSAVSVMTDEDTMKGRNVMVATMAL